MHARTKQTQRKECSQRVRMSSTSSEGKKACIVHCAERAATWWREGVLDIDIHHSRSKISTVLRTRYSLPAPHPAGYFDYEERRGRNLDVATAECSFSRPFDTRLRRTAWTELSGRRRRLAAYIRSPVLVGGTSYVCILSSGVNV